MMKRDELTCDNVTIVVVTCHTVTCDCYESVWDNATERMNEMNAVSVTLTQLTLF